MLDSQVRSYAVTARRAGGAFHAVAAFSVFNSIAALVSLRVVPGLGLGITQLHDQLVLRVLVSQAVGMELVLLRLLGPSITLLFAAALVFLGWHARKLARWAFGAGLAFYALDTGILALTADWLSVALHGLVLAVLGVGFAAAGRVGQMDGWGAADDAQAA